MEEGQSLQLTMHNFGAAQSADSANVGFRQITGDPNAQIYGVTLRIWWASRRAATPSLRAIPVRTPTAP